MSGEGQFRLVLLISRRPALTVHPEVSARGTPARSSGGRGCQSCAGLGVIELNSCMDALSSLLSSWPVERHDQPSQALNPAFIGWESFPDQALAMKLEA